MLVALLVLELLRSAGPEEDVPVVVGELKVQVKAPRACRSAWDPMLGFASVLQGKTVLAVVWAASEKTATTLA
jgi:hypothetical protein